jgi:hypothetical protein
MGLHHQNNVPHAITEPEKECALCRGEDFYKLQAW